MKDSPIEIDVNEGETCSCDEETTLEFLFSFLLREIIFSSDLEPHRKSRIDQVFELLQANHLSPFDVVLRVLDEGNAQYSFYRAEFYKNNRQKLS